MHASGREFVATIVERVSGSTLIGKLPNVTAGVLNDRVLRLLWRNPRAGPKEPSASVNADGAPASDALPKT